MHDRRRYNPRISELVQLLDDDDLRQRRLARERLVKIGRRATPWLLTLLESRRCRRRRDAAGLLAEIADPRTVPKLVRALADTDATVRGRAAAALARIGRPALIPMLVLLEEQADDPGVREGVSLVLGSWRDWRTQTVVAPLRRELLGAGDTANVFEAAERAIKNLL